MNDPQGKQRDTTRARTDFGHWPLVYTAVVVCGALMMVALYAFSRYFSG